MYFVVASRESSKAKKGREIEPNTRVDVGGADEETIFHCNGYYEFDKENIKPVKIKCLGHHGDVNIEKILKYSCNAGAAYASETMSDDEFYQMLKMFDFGEKTNVLMPSESRGIFRENFYARWIFLQAGQR